MKIPALQKRWFQYSVFLWDSRHRKRGLLEMLQGNVAPNDIMMDAISPAQRFWEYASEPGLTIIPNFLITGVLAVVFGYPLLWVFDANVTHTIQWTSAFIMVVLWPVSIINELAYDIQKENS